ncbi:hypothetical protein [Sutcliffiella rhizosphaerae]|uniref:hypothetical protein n=1 Tax=Sutcliffiella rhizosphaerae TaxID=2880967 RepID=UPI001E29ADCE|nr:hypothetical protein [Sutcliffiella rhizosphaerae]
MLLRGAIAGGISGIIMGLSLKWMETVTTNKVYVLLLNVDFIPFLRNQEYSEFTEFCFHLVIAVIVGVLYSLIISKLHIYQKSRQYLTSILITTPTILLYFPLTSLAIKETPSVTNGTAIFLWTVGHILFAIFLPTINNLFKKG